MIGLEIFNGLSLPEQADYAWDHGTYLGTAVDEINRVHLYSLSDYYVEIYYLVEGNKIEDIKAFKKGPKLSKYLEQIRFDL